MIDMPHPVLLGRPTYMFLKCAIAKKKLGTLPRLHLVDIKLHK